MHVVCAKRGIVPIAKWTARELIITDATLLAARRRAAAVGSLISKQIELLQRRNHQASEGVDVTEC